MSEESLFEVLGAPESEELVRIDGKPLDDGLPSHIIKATNWDHWIDEDDEDLRILDFGETFRQGAEPEDLPSLDTCRCQKQSSQTSSTIGLIYGVQA